MATFLRFRKREDGAYVLLNMDHVVTIEEGVSQNDEGGWSRLTHVTEDGNVSATEVLTSFDDLSSMLAGVWEKDAD